MNKPKILIVDDEPDIIEFLSYNLENNNFDVYSATDGNKAIKIAKEVIPHIILLDIMMPAMDGIETCQELRKLPQLKKTLIALLTARGEDYSQIAGFDAGADDYITKPIKIKVLISRINALLKRLNLNDNMSIVSEDNNTLIAINNIVIDKENYMVKVGKDELSLPKKEFELLLLLVSKPGKVFTREEIFNKVWGSDIIVGDRTIDVHIRKLREKIGDEYIKTIKGVGYKFIVF
jgi:two-component system alkaline phosphatase synthesis response regulator PhoP